MPAGSDRNNIREYASFHRIKEEVQTFEARTEALRVQVQRAILACELIMDSEHGQEIRGDAKTALKNVLAELEKLDASMTRPKATE